MSIVPRGLHPRYDHGKCPVTGVEGCFSNRNVLCYVAMDAFGFHQPYSLSMEMVERIELPLRQRENEEIRECLSSVLACFSIRDVLNYVTVNVFCFHPSYSLAHSLALVETDSAKLCFYMQKSVLWMCAMDGFPTIDTSNTRAAYLPRIATLRQHIFIAHLQYSLSIGGNGLIVL
ncbi:hypothetical protein SFRURICE_019579 [Spodoptera frugiperda]|nr:hypothetical protein SFRURICE_019579 [Spodoptera frugiperda]